MANAEQETPVRAPLPIKTFLTSVARIEPLDPPFTRVTFRGGDLVHFEPIGPDQFLYLLLPPAGRSELTIDSSFDWNRYREMPESERPIGAYYTVRHHRPDVAEIDIDIVRHGHEGQVGTWLRRARPGDPVALWGPRMAYAPLAQTEQLLLIGDETALPAIAAILEALEAGPGPELVRIIVELDRATVLPLNLRAGSTLTRLDKPSNGSSKLPAEIRSHQYLAHTYAWGAGEVDLMSQLRAYLRDCVGLRSEQVSMVGYWRRDSD